MYKTQTIFTNILCKETAWNHDQKQTTMMGRKNNVLPKSQSGFRKGQSTVDNLTNLTVNIEDLSSKKHDTLAAFLDVSGAFNHVNIEIMLQKLADTGCPLNLIQFIKFQMYGRIVTTELTENDSRRISRKVLQGGVLTPLLYCIYVAKITDETPKSVRIS